jgi:hypothetical protein
MANAYQRSEKRIPNHVTIPFLVHSSSTAKVLILSYETLSMLWKLVLGGMLRVSVEHLGRNSFVDGAGHPNEVDPDHHML